MECAGSDNDRLRQSIYVITPMLWAGSPNPSALHKHTRIVDEDDPDDLEAEQHHNRRQVDPAQVRHETPDPRIDRVQNPFQCIPDLPDKLLPQVKDFKPDEPTHNEMRDDEKPHNAND